MVCNSILGPVVFQNVLGGWRRYFIIMKMIFGHFLDERFCCHLSDSSEYLDSFFYNVIFLFERNYVLKICYYLSLKKKMGLIYSTDNFKLLT